jgi:hypothetical protein
MSISATAWTGTSKGLNVRNHSGVDASHAAVDIPGQVDTRARSAVDTPGQVDTRITES